MTTAARQRPSRFRILRILLRKEVVNLRQHPYQLVALALPLFMSVIFTTIFPAVESGDQIQIVVYDPGDSALVTGLANQPDVAVVAVPTAEDVLPTLNELGDGVTAGLALPAGLDTAVASNQIPTITVYINDQARSSNQTRFRQILGEQIWALSGNQPPITTDWRIINPDLPSSQDISLREYLFLSMTLLGLSLVAMTIPQTMLEDKSANTLPPLLASPVTMPDLLLAKAILGFGYGLIVLITMFLYHQGWAGNWGYTAVATLLTLALLTALGLLLGIYGKSKGQNNVLITILTLAINMPSWFAVTSLSSLPDVAAFAVRLLPTHYTIEIVRLALNNEATLANTAVSFTILSLVTLALWGWVGWQAKDTAVLTRLITSES